MSIQSIWYSVFGGVRKNQHLPYFIHGFYMLAKPRFLTERKRESILREFDAKPAAEQDYIINRVNYYNRLQQKVQLPADALVLGNQNYWKKPCSSVYFFDSYEQNRYFPKDLRWLFGPGDVTWTFDAPTIVKSRPIKACLDNPNSVIVNMEKVRHFMFFNDPIPFGKKHNQVIFRGAVHGKPARMKFLETYFNHPLFNIYDTSKNSTYPKEMRLNIETSIYDHLGFKYIMSLEGNDVASNLKWVMNSNSIAVAPPLNYETWFMEGTLRPGEHFIAVKPDFSDIAEKIAYYNDHPGEALSITEAAHEHCRQFFDKKRERLIALMVMQKYFEMTGQL